ncbi:sensor histidine kinase [Pseudactinotalea sp. Z1748]|uniref:sensor histidine kinase n=1 Tax=Pseudactinotalea sp. Z1748 TaxID=3413027 RepID=UPI003C7E5744
MSAPATSGTSPAKASDVTPERPRGELGAPSTPRPWQRPPITRTQWHNDAFASLALFAVALLSMAMHRAAQMLPEPAAPVISVLTLAAVTLPLAWRRRYPTTVLIVLSAAFVVLGEAMVPETLVTNIALFLALYTVGAWVSDRRRALIVRLIVVAVMFSWLLVSFFRVATDPPDGETVDFGAGSLSPLAAFMLIQLFINVLYFAGAIWFGNHAWKAAWDRDLLLQRAHELQAERALVEAQAVTIERMRLARELHDAVAHHISLIGVQAAAARTLLDRDTARAVGALENVEQSARNAISELQTLLGTLRAEPDDGVGPGSADPVGSLGVERIPDLIEDARHGGLQVQYQVIGEPVPMRPLASLNLYRIAQEALTNARKHAGNDAGVDVRLRYLPEAVELEVADDGAGRRRRPVRPGSGGLGLVGMRERVGTDGGTLHVGPRREGGFLVRAQVPLTPTALTADEHRSPDDEQEPSA